MTSEKGDWRIDVGYAGIWVLIAFGVAVVAMSVLLG